MPSRPHARGGEPEELKLILKEQQERAERAMREAEAMKAGLDEVAE